MWVVNTWGTLEPVQRIMKNVALCFAFCLLACSPARREAETDIVRGIRFEGNGGPMSGHNDYQLRAQMEQKSSAVGVLVWPLTYFVEPRQLDTRLLERDAFRLEMWYANHGWFDASVEGWELRRARAIRPRRQGVVDIIGRVDPGPQSVVRELEFSGLRRTQRLLAKTVARTGELRKGDVFTLSDAYSNRDRLLELLHDHAHAYARVELTVDAYPKDRVVDLKYEVEPGITTSIGPISVVGNRKIKAEYIHKSLPIKEGDPYRYSSLRRSQQRLFEMKTFSLVSVTPDLSDPTRNEVPIEVRVTEAKARRLRAGGGLEYDGINLAPQLSASFGHVNLFRELLRFESEAKLGFLYGFEGGWRELPTVLASGRLRYPRLINHAASLDIAYTYELDYQAGQFPVEQVDTEISFSWKISDALMWSVGPDWRWFTYRLEPDEELSNTLEYFGEETSRLLQWKSSLSLDWRDDVFRTRRGSYYNMSVAYAMPVGALTTGQDPISEWHFLSLSAEARTYRPVRFQRGSDFPLTAAGRMYGQWIGSFGESQVPYLERVFLGGANNLRGFRRDQVGAYDCVCQGEGDELVRYYFPEGGKILAGISGEFRYDWAYGISFAAFADAAMLVDDWVDLGGDALRVGFGLGARYNSLVGPVRFDIGMRPVYDEDRGARNYLGCDEPGEALPRASDLLGGSRDFRLFKLEERLPLALNIYFTFGEAI
jgi:outer membrane protein assembly factor BamA